MYEGVEELILKNTNRKVKRNPGTRIVPLFASSFAHGVILGMGKITRSNIMNKVCSENLKSHCVGDKIHDPIL